MRKILALLAVAVLAACDSKPATTSSTSTGPSTPSTSTTTGPAPSTAPEGPKNDPSVAPDPETRISGKVSYSAKAPKRGKIDVSPDPVCASQYPEDNPLLKEDLIVSADGGVQNAIVWVKRGLEGRTFPAPSEPVTLGQKGCKYTPHVFGVVAGQGVKAVNDDGTTHNVHLVPVANSGDNKTQKPGQENTWKLSTPEAPFKIICDIHSWMGAYCLVSPHPYFVVTGPDGSYELKGLPPGTYDVEVWHEKLGTKSATVKVEPKGKVAQSFAFDK